MENSSSNNQSEQEALFNVDQAITDALEGSLYDIDQTAIIEKLIKGTQDDANFRNALILLFIPELFAPFVAKNQKSRRSKSARPSSRKKATRKSAKKSTKQAAE